MKYEEKLSKMIQVETVSVRGELNLEKFEAFQSVLRELFPNVFKTMEFKSFDGLIYDGTLYDPEMDRKKKRKK